MNVPTQWTQPRQFRKDNAGAGGSKKDGKGEGKKGGSKKGARK